MLIAAGNSGDAGLVPQVEALLGDASPLVRAMAVWAMRRLTADGVGERLRHLHLTREADSQRARRMAGRARRHDASLFCFGLGYSALHLARRLHERRLGHRRHDTHRRRR